MGLGQDEVAAMTVVAGGCHKQTLFEQPLTVDVLRKVIQDVLLSRMVYAGHRLPFTMTPSTK
jgi:hypothetical protein